MKIFILLAIVAFCGTFGNVKCEKKKEFHYIRTEKMNETEEFFKYEIKKIQKDGDFKFIVDADVDLFTTLDNDFHMWINIYHNAEGKEEFGVKPLMSLPKKAFCDFMSTIYKDNLYDQIKDFSNFPAPDACPVEPNHFFAKNFVFDASKYSSFGRPGMWKIDLFISQDHEDSHITKLGVSIFGSLTESEK